MVYRVLSDKELALEREHIESLPKAIRSIKKLEKYGMAKRKKVADYEFGKKVLANNLKAQLAVNDAFLHKIGNYYAWLRQKIQDPVTPTGQKAAYRKMAKILENDFGIDKLTESSEFFKKWNKGKQPRPSKQAYSFCYVKQRI